MNNSKKIERLKEKIKELSADRFHRFNALLLKEAFEKLEAEAKKQKKSKAKVLNSLILQK